MDALVIKDLDYIRKSDWLLKGKQTLHKLSFNVKKGEVFALLGTNGAGKTTTIKCILDLLKVKSGSVKIFDKDFRDYKSKDFLAYLPEHTYFYDNIKAKESIVLGAKLSGLNNINSKLEVVVKKLEIEHLLTKKMKDMSKGQKQRVSLAQALIAKPKLLILDEPYSGLDPLGRKKFTEIFLELKEKGVSILVSSHILSDVERIADRVGILKAGKLKGVFDIKSIVQKTDRNFELTLKASKEKLELEELSLKVNGDYLNYTFSNKEIAQKALSDSLNKGFEVISFGPAHGALEDLFVNLVKE